MLVNDCNLIVFKTIFVLIKHIYKHKILDIQIGEYSFQEILNKDLFYLQRQIQDQDIKSYKATKDRLEHICQKNSQDLK